MIKEKLFKIIKSLIPFWCAIIIDLCCYLFGYSEDASVIISVSSFFFFYIMRKLNELKKMIERGN